MDRFTSSPAIGGIIVVAVLYRIAVIVYRLYFHPLAKFPGPKLTAATGLVQFYYDCIHGDGGQFPFAVRKWHDQYGPIIRINPTEIHIRDSTFHESLYSASRPSRKPRAVGDCFGAGESAFGSEDHNLHRSRRGALNPFFSRRKVAEYAPELQKKMDHIMGRLKREYDGTGLVLRLNQMWGSFSADSVFGFCFEPDRQYHFLDTPGFYSTLNEATAGMSEPLHWMLHMPLVRKALMSLPGGLVKAMDEKMGSFVEFKEELHRQISFVLQARSKGEKAGNTLFSSLCDQGLPPEELTLDRLQQEAVSIVGAGAEATTRSMSVACFHILDQPKVRARLVAELAAAIPNPQDMPSWDQLSQLPFLAACGEEALRLTYGVGHRIQRSFPDPLIYRNHVIPPGFMVSMDTYDVCHDENIFPDSHKFIPDRWLGDPKAPDGKKLSSHMVSFSRGPRSCTGMQLAYAEMHISLANFFRSPLGMKACLYETDKSDVVFARDRFAPRPRLGSLGVRVVFK